MHPPIHAIAAALPAILCGLMLGLAARPAIADETTAVRAGAPAASAASAASPARRFGRMHAMADAASAPMRDGHGGRMRYGAGYESRRGMAQRGCMGMSPPGRCAEIPISPPSTERK